MSEIYSKHIAIGTIEPKKFKSVIRPAFALLSAALMK